MDWLVIMQTTAKPADLYVAVSRAIRPRPFPRDILGKTPDEIAGALARGDRFIQEIVTRASATRMPKSTGVAAMSLTSSGR